MKTIFLVGPTAAGKTAVSIVLAQRLDAEIVSADSMQIYRGMDIGTAKPTEMERAGVRHHLLDVVEITEPFDVAQYRRLAITAIADIHRRGKTALVVGGTGLYVRALLRGLDELPSDSELRRRLENQTLEQLVAQLAARDPLAAAKIDLKNKRRVVRALEVLELTRRSIVAQQQMWAGGGLAEMESEGMEEGKDGRTRETANGRRGEGESSGKIYPLIGITRHRGDLYQRCDARVDEMFVRGLVDEVRTLLARGLDKNRTAMQAVGYKEVVAHVRGQTSLAECIASVKIATRHLAKRQLTWFRRETNLIWVEISKNEPVEQTAQRVLEVIEQNKYEQ